jgi:hypothetical protein
LAFIAPFRCREPVRRDNSPCRNVGYGVLIGCHTHRLDKLLRTFGRPARTPGAPLRRTRQVSAAPATSPAPATPSSLGRMIYGSSGFSVGVSPSGGALWCGFVGAPPRAPALPRGWGVVICLFGHRRRTADLARWQGAGLAALGR